MCRETGTHPQAGSLDAAGFVPQENPLLLTGLAFAGANRRADASSTDEDGMLTAEEVAALDLSGVDWVVLSACKTGTGEWHEGEGILGLRRAFRTAGARTLITSLWDVEDETTQRWMKELYEARFVRGLDTTLAMREARRVMLEERRRTGESTRPVHWAGFVSSGAWD
jgi:CHAT domain-containing protein